MDGPREPGYYPSMTGSEERHPIQDPEIGYGPPKYLIAQVYRYGKRRWWVRGPLRLWIRSQDCEMVWESERVSVGPDVMSESYEQAVVDLMARAEAIVDLFTAARRKRDEICD